MSIRDNIRALLGGRKRAEALNDPRNGLAFGRIIPGSDIDVSPIGSKREAAQTYAGWVFAASTFIAEEMRALEWSLYRRTSVRRDEWEADTRHELNDVLRRPNGGESWGDFIERSSVSFNVAGEVFWHVIRDRNRAIGLQIVLPHWINEPTFDRDGKQAGWRVTIPGRAPLVLPVDDVIRIHRPHPMNPWMAASVVEAAAVSHYFDLYLRAYGMTTFRNDGGIPAGLLSSDQSLTPEQATLMQERWKQRYSQSRGEVAVLGQNAKYQPIGIPMGDLKFLDTGKFTRDQILSLFRVPSALLGDAGDVNRASIDGHLYSFQRHALRPQASRFGDAMNHRVLPIFMSEHRGYWWGFDDVVMKDRAQIREEAKESLGAGAITVNEYRQKLDQDPVDGGDVYLLPNTHRVAATFEEAQPAEPPSEPEEGEEDAARASPDVGAALVMAAAQRRAQRAEAEAATLRREAAERKAYSSLRGLFARWWRDRDGDRLPLDGLSEHGLTVDDLPDVAEGETVLAWVERLKGPEGKRLAALSVERS